MQVKGENPQEGLTGPALDWPRFLPTGLCLQGRVHCPVLPDTGFRQRQCSGHAVPQGELQDPGSSATARGLRGRAVRGRGRVEGWTPQAPRAVCGPGSSSAAVPWWHAAPRLCPRLAVATSASQGCVSAEGVMMRGVEPVPGWAPDTC